MTYSLTREAAIRFLIEAKILDEIEGSHEFKVGVVRFSKMGSQMGSSNGGIKFCCLRVPKNTLIRLYNDRKQSINRSYISALYSIGLGVPRNQECAQFWHMMANGTCKCQSYGDYSKLLKQQLRETLSDSYYVYSNDVLKQSRVLEAVKTKGVKCAVIYKDTVGGYQLHNIIVGGYTIIYNLRPNRLGIETSVKANVKSNTKYIARLGTLDEGGDYNLKLSLLDAVKELATSPWPDEKLITDFSKQVFFDHRITVAIDYQWRITQFKRKI